MSLSGILGNTLMAAVRGQYQHVSSPFKKYGQDTLAGNTTKAQTDFVTLSPSVKAGTIPGSPIGHMLNSLGQALQAGDLTAAQNCLSAIRRVGPCAAPKGSHVPPMIGTLSQGLTALGQALQAGDLSTARQAYSAVQQVWQQITGDRTILGDTPSTASGLSVRS